ncbi:dTDP-4-dehydrorhamnose reductase [Sphingomonas sp. UYEF23]
MVTSLAERGVQGGHEVVTIGRPEVDLADPSSIYEPLRAAAPDVVVSAAAYTAVDRAESERDLAYAINGVAAGAIADAAYRLGVPLIHISTDYVFDGRLDRPYTEQDQTRPTGLYGASKLAGEEAVLAAYPRNSVILRTAWVYSPFGNNFVKTMLRLATQHAEVSVVDDQRGNPTSALSIADGILQIADNILSEADYNPALRGVFHMTADGEASWADFAQAIFEVSAAAGGPSAVVKRIPSEAYPTPAARPANSRLCCDGLRAAHGVILPTWRGALQTVVLRLLANNLSSRSEGLKVL